MKKVFLFAMACLLSFAGMAQKTKSVLRSDEPITWLGLDFTQARIIGAANQWKDVGEISDAQLRDKYIPGWNDLFLNEQKKYDVAKYADRNSVEYAIDVTGKQNSRKYSKAIFSDDPSDYKRLDEQKIDGVIRGYDFMGKSGVGLLFIVEGMSKGKEEACAWVTLVDMKSKKVLQTQRIYGKAGGFGFRNYWAKAFFNILKDMRSEMR